MWKYGNNPSEEYFSTRMDLVERLFEKYGAVSTDLNKAQRERFHYRRVYYYENGYYRVSYVPFDDKPFIVIEATDSVKYADNGAMEDTDLFPYDYPDWKFDKQVRFLFEIEPYPKTYPDY